MRGIVELMKAVMVFRRLLEIEPDSADGGSSLLYAGGTVIQDAEIALDFEEVLGETGVGNGRLDGLPGTAGTFVVEELGESNAAVGDGPAVGQGFDESGLGTGAEVPDFENENEMGEPCFMGAPGLMEVAALEDAVHHVLQVFPFDADTDRDTSGVGVAEEVDVAEPDRRGESHSTEGAEEVPIVPLFCAVQTGCQLLGLPFLIAFFAWLMSQIASSTRPH